jgi:hypothetical protein
MRLSTTIVVGLSSHIVSIGSLLALDRNRVLLPKAAA